MEVLLWFLISITATTSQLDSILNSAEVSLSLVMITWILPGLLIWVLGISITVRAVITIFILMSLLALTHRWKWV